MKLTESSLVRAKKFLDYKNNPIKWIKDCVYLPEAGGDTHMTMYKPQEEMLKMFLEKHYVIILKSRQTGFSTLAQVVIAYLCTFYDNVVCGITSKDLDEASDACRKTLDILEKQPKWLVPKFLKKTQQSFITNKGNQLHARAVSPTNPSSLFRGKAITFLVVDEAAFIRQMEDAWTAVGPTLFKSQSVAKNKGIPYGTIVLSTPNKTNGIGRWFYDSWVQSINGRSTFQPIKIHWTEVEDFKSDPNWYPAQCAILNNDTRRIAQELELKFISAEGSLFSEIVQERLQNKNEEPQQYLEIGKNVKLWQFPRRVRREKFHLIGVDCASASGTDYSTIEVLEFESVEQIFELQIKCDPKEFASYVKKVAQLVPHNIIIVDNTGGYGSAILSELMTDEEFEYNVLGEWRGSGTSKKYIPGVNINVKTRPMIVDALYSYVDENPELIRSKRLAMELVALTNRSNKIEADKGFNDDLCFAYGLACYGRKYCSEVLGNTDDVDENKEYETTILSEAYSLITSLNDGSEAVLRSEYKNSEDYDAFKKKLHHHLTEKRIAELAKGQVPGGYKLIQTTKMFQPDSLWNK